jgi:hypothetical protein
MSVLLWQENAGRGHISGFSCGIPPFWAFVLTLILPNYNRCYSRGAMEAHAIYIFSVTVFTPARRDWASVFFRRQTIDNRPPLG